MGEIIIVWALVLPARLSPQPPLSFHPTQASCVSVAKARGLGDGKWECIPGQYVIPPEMKAKETRK